MTDDQCAALMDATADEIELQKSLNGHKYWRESAICATDEYQKQMLAGLDLHRAERIRDLTRRTADEDAEMHDLPADQ
jgi:hypothetical protein